MDLTIRQIKEFIKWAKTQGIKEINVAGVHVVFTEVYENQPELTNTNTPIIDDEEALYYSS